MSILFAMPNWRAPSEVWLQRMLHMLSADLDSVVAWKTEGRTSWNGVVPAFPLIQHEHPMRVRLRRMGLPFPVKTTEYVMRKCVKRPGITGILCHYGNFATDFMSIWKDCRTPLYIHFHGGDATFDIRKHETPDERFFDDEYIQKLKELSARAMFIANSKFTRDLLVSGGISAEKIVIKYIGVPIPEVEKEHKDKDTITILHIGRLVDCKSPDRTILAFEEARRNGMKAKLIIVGDGPMKLTCELLRVRSAYRDSIQLLGAVTTEKVQELLTQSDIFTQHNIQGELSHQQECYGVAVVEAMSVGLPVVATRNGGVQETVVHEETGFLGTPGDVSEQAGFFLRLAGDHAMRQKFGAAGRRRAIDYFSYETEKRKLREILGLSLD